MARVQDVVATINLRLRESEEAQRSLAAEIAAGDRIQKQREIYRAGFGACAGILHPRLRLPHLPQ